MKIEKYLNYIIIISLIILVTTFIIYLFKSPKKIEKFNNESNIIYSKLNIYNKPAKSTYDIKLNNTYLLSGLEISNKDNISNYKIKINESYLENNYKINTFYKLNNIKTDNLLIEFSNPVSNMTITLYGHIYSNKIETFSEIVDRLNDRLSSATQCPNLNELVKKQYAINNLCMSLVEKDKQRNYQNYYDKLKLYLSKLKSQNTEINYLQEKINKLTGNKNNNDIKDINKLLDEINIKNNEFINQINIVNTSNL